MYQIELERKPIAEFLTRDDLGTYCLPSVQRDFVWEEDEVIDLIDSLLRGYPTGVVTILETNIDFPSVPLIDVQNAKSPESNGTRRYVLDGQQRLTSLLLIRDGWKITRNHKQISIDPIMLNPDDGKLRKKGKRQFGYDFSKLIRWTLHKEYPTEIIPRIQTTLEQMNKDFLIRPMGFFVVRVNKDEKNEDRIYSDMAEIFTRINRAGIKLGNIEMFLSFFASASSGKQEIVDLYERLKASYNVDLEPLIRLVFSNFDLTQSQIAKIESFKKSVKLIQQKYDTQQIIQNIGASGESIRVVMEALKDQFGITDAESLPSQTPLVILSKYVLRKGYTSSGRISSPEVSNMLKWFTVSSFYGAYSSHTDSRLEEDVKIINSSVDFPISDLTKSMAERSLRTAIEEQDFKNIDFNILRGNAGKRFLFLLYVLLHRNGATAWTGTPIAKNGTLVKHHILPKDNEVVKKVIDDDITRNHLGNLTFIDAGKNEEIGDSLPEEYLAQMKEEALKEHFIPTDRSLWKPDRYEDFINWRMNRLWDALKELMGTLSQ